MKRSLIVILGLIFVLGITASAFAIHAEIPSETQSIVAKGSTQITLGGELRFRGETRNNTTDFNNGAGDRYNAYDGRVRLNLQADVSKNTTGYVQLESGDTDTADTYTWGDSPNGSDGSTANGATGIYTEGNGKRGDMRILQAWIQSKDVIGPIGFKVGHMPVKLGNGLFLDHSKFGDDALMVFANPTKELEIALVNAKATEGTTQAAGGWTTYATTASGRVTYTPSYTTQNDDTNVYAGLINYKGAGFNLGADVTYLNDQNYAAEGLRFWNYGVRMDSKMGPIGLFADIEYQNGTAKDMVQGAPDVAQRNTEFQGHAALAGVNFKTDTVTLDATIATGSGDGDNADNKINTFVTSLGSDQHYTYVYEYRTRTAGVTAPTAGRSALGGTGTGIANTTYYKVGAAMKPSKDLALNVNGYVLKATKAVANCNSVDWTQCPYTSSNIGTEIDGKMTYQLDKNLVYFIEGGYLIAGNFYRNLVMSTGSQGAEDPDNPYAVRHGVTLSF